MRKAYALATTAILFATTLNAQLGFTNASGLLSNTTHSGGCVGVADMDGDGLDDIGKLHLSRFFQIEYQNTDGSFALVEHGAVSDEEQWGMALGDIENDGHKDLISGGSYDGVHFLRIDAPGVASLEALPNDDMFMQCNNIVDIDGDSHNDFFACHDHAAPRTWLNDGNGDLLHVPDLMDFSTTPPSDMSGNYGSVWTDFDNDGDLDLYIAKCKQGVSDINNPLRWNQLFVNDGNGNFTEAAAAHGIQVKYQSWTGDFADIDNDGDLDLVVTNHDHTVQLFENDGTGNFTEITAGSGLEITGFFLQSKFVDFDNDGFVDLLLTGGIERFFRNNGDQTFTQVNNLFPAAQPMHSFATGDLNNDGFPDLFSSYGNTYVEPDMTHPDRLWMNNGNDNHWLTVRLQGTMSNRDAIGARVTIDGPWGTQIREVRAGESYGIVTTFACMFGLGAHTTIPTLTVNWPSGLEEVFTNVAVDQTLTIIEGTCISPNAQIAFPGPQVLCTGGGAITLEANAGYSYQWNTGEQTQQISVSEPGFYSVTIDDDSGCTGIASVHVPLDPDETPQIQLSSDPLICEGTTVELSSGSAFPATWSTGETGPSIEVGEAGDYTVTVAGSCTDHTSAPVTIETLSSPPAPVADDVAIEIGEQALLQAAGDNIQWYDQPDGGVAIASGDTYQTPPLTSTTSYWASASQVHEGAVHYGGREENHAIGGYHNNAIYYLRFEVYEAMRLVSVKVYANGAGVRPIGVVSQSDGSTVASGNYDIPDGESRVDLDIDLEPGSYALRVMSGNPQLWRDQQGSDPQYPYALGDLGAITGTNNTGGLSTELYYFFYDWEVKALDVTCEGPRTEVVVHVGNVGMQENDGSSFKVWPVPTDGMLTVDLSGLQDVGSIEVLDMLGRPVTSRASEAGAERLEMDLGHLASGEYLLKVMHRHGITIQQLIINK